MRMLLLADMHVGSIKDTSYVYSVVTEIIEREVIFNKCDVVVILGDYFHRLFKVNEDYVSCAINIMSFLVRACARNNTKIRIVYGTESHEMNQYKLFNYHFTSSHVDVKVFDTVTEEEISPGVNILYVPEEYMKDKKKFYKQYLDSDKRYNYIFGHGVIEDGMPAVVSYGEKKSEEKQVPRFKSGELAAAGDLVVFGHYHTYTDIGNNVYYLGSLFRRSFGEEEPKGYGIIEDGKFTFVENTRAYIYKSYEYAPDSDIYKSSDAIINEIRRIKEENADVFSGEKPGKIRMIFRLPDTVETNFKENLQDIMMNEKKIVTLIKGNMDTIMQEVKEEIGDEWDYLMDPNMPITEKIYKWINDTTGYELSMDLVKKHVEGKV